jgi:predicted nucleic acid-binding protein
VQQPVRQVSGRLVVPSPILTEVCYKAESRLGSETEALFLDSLVNGEFELEAVDASDLSRMAELVRRYKDFPLGAADAPVVAVAERLKATRVATLDHRHFRAVRPTHCDAFELLPVR